LRLQEKMMILTQNQLAPNIFAMKLTGDLVKQMHQPGQFLHIRVPLADLLLRRPISLAEIDRKNNTCTIIYRIEGVGTDYFSKMQAGDKLDIFGPLGVGFDTNVVENQVALIIGGGIGVPPLYELSKQLAKKGAKIIHLFGFASQEVIFYEDEFRALGEVHIATDDGSRGLKGHVGDLLAKLVKKTTDFAAVYACGAINMLKLIDQKFADHPQAYLSMESRMACGMGACYACVCREKEDATGEKALKVCTDGPVFKTGRVVFE